MFAKGQSGNPGGQSKAVSEMRGLIRERGPELVERLFALAQNARADRDRLTAIGMLLDRGFGKPVQAVQSEDGGPVVMQVQWLPAVSPDTGKSE